MRRLRPLSEAECYARCYGGWDDTVRIVRLQPRRARRELAVEGEALRVRFEEFLGAAERLERIADELKPAWIGFVGKEAYRGAFNERPELGVQKRRLVGAQLFVLPSTSPANAAVPWVSRERWFQELAGRSSGFGLR